MTINYKNMKTLKLYGDFFKDLLDISKKRTLYSESVLGQIMKSHRLKIRRINFLIELES